MRVKFFTINITKSSEDFGSHIFKEDVVVPGNTTFDDQYYSVKLNDTQFGVDLSFYIDKLVGKVITGQSSGTTAKVVRVVFQKFYNR